MNKARKRIIVRQGLVCIFLALALFMYYITPVEAEWLRDKQPVVNSPWAKTEGKFGVTLYLTDNKDEVFKKWLEDTEYVDIDIAEELKVKRNVLVAALIIFSNCTPDKRGLANVTASFAVYGPNGDLYAAREELEVWVNKPVPPDKILELGVDYMGVAAGKNHPNGLYLVKALVLDKNSKTIIELERKFEVID